MKQQYNNDIKTFKPITPSLRHTILFRSSTLSKSKKSLKYITKGQKQQAGRSKGQITVRRRGGGSKRKYRVIDFIRKEINRLLVCGIEYDPNRSSSIARVKNLQTSKVYYILAASGMKVGHVLDNNRAANSYNMRSGTSFLIKDIPIGVKIHSIEIYPNKGGQLVRSAGTFAKILAKDISTRQIKLCLPSKKIITLPFDCRATLGQVSNESWQNKNLGKAGRSRWNSRRPRVRGVAMNPVDHPMGGGEGKSSGGRPSVSKWGKVKKNVSTAKNK